MTWSNGTTPLVLPVARPTGVLRADWPDQVLARASQRKPQLDEHHWLYKAGYEDGYARATETLAAENERLREALADILHTAEHPAKPSNALDGIASCARGALGEAGE